MLGVTAVELSSLIAAVRIAADVLEADEQTPPEAVARLRALLATTSVRPPAWIGQVTSRGTGRGSPGPASA